MESYTGQFNRQQLMIEGIRGHLTALDHAVRLLVAGSANAAVLQSAWLTISAGLAIDAADPRQYNSDLYCLALTRCADRIMQQLDEALRDEELSR